MMLDKERLNLHHLVSECQHKVSNLAEQKQLSFQIQRDVDIEWDGDPKLLFHAFEAVLDNAVKFAHRGTVVDITFQWVGTHAQVCIANEGDPIHEDHLEDIFDAFFVSDLEHHHRGHGLSLAIAGSIVEAHGGALQVENRRTGPVFVFNL